MQKMERVYNVVRDVLEKEQLTNDTSILLDEVRISVSVTAIETDRMEKFEQLRSKFGQAFVDAKLREKVDGSSRIGGHYHDISYTWHMDRAVGEDMRIVFLDIAVPRAGLADYAIVEKREDYATYALSYEFVERSKSIDGVVE